MERLQRLTHEHDTVKKNLTGKLFQLQGHFQTCHILDLTHFNSDYFWWMTDESEMFLSSFITEKCCGVKSCNKVQHMSPQPPGEKNSKWRIVASVWFKLLNFRVPAAPRLHVNSYLLHLIEVFAVISSKPPTKMTHVQNVKKAGSNMEDSAIISPPINQPGKKAK